MSDHLDLLLGDKVDTFNSTDVEQCCSVAVAEIARGTEVKDSSVGCEAQNAITVVVEVLSQKVVLIGSCDHNASEIVVVDCSKIEGCHSIIRGVIRECCGIDFHKIEGAVGLGIGIECTLEAVVLNCVFAIRSGLTSELNEVLRIMLPNQ